MPKIPVPTIIRSNRKTIALQLYPDGSLVVKAPLLASERSIQQVLSEHEEWILERIEKMRAIKARPKERMYVSGEKFWYLGVEHVLTIGDYPEIAVRDGKLLFPAFLQFRIQKELTAWYIRQARTIITEQVVYFAREMQASYTDITFSDTKSQWGRCTHDNRLQFSWRLVMAPMLTLNYVVVHELAHTFQKNHSISFWNKVRFYNPSYRQQRKWLETYGNSIIV